jgi:hypothetical protein
MVTASARAGTQISYWRYNMSVDNVSSIERYNHSIELKRLDRQHEDLLIEQRLIAERLKETEEKRIEMNRRMNRPGQNVDKIA